MIRIGAAVVAVLAAVGATAFFFNRGHSVGAHETARQAEAAEHGERAEALPVSVRAVHPQLDADYKMTVERPCTAEAYYRAPIEARASGVIRFLGVDKGDEVKKDQLLIQIDVPDRAADVKETFATVQQRLAEVNLAQEKVAAAESLVKTALASIKEHEAQTEFRLEQYKRLYALRNNSNGSAVDQNVVDESRKNLKYAEAAVLKAKAELEDAEANVRVAKAELAKKKAEVKVSEGHWEQAKAKLDYGSVKAPFDGTITERRVSLGATVQDATRGDKPSPLLILERNDIVTVVMQLPDNSANLVTKGTEAIIEFPTTLPGLKIRGKVTRFSRSLANPNNDRSMRVEVDLWNRSAPEYNQFLKAIKLHPAMRRDMKSGPLPVLPEFTGKDRLKRSTDLMSGTYGNMTLVLRNFGKTYLIPSPAIIREGGRTKVYVIKDGKAHLIPVEVVVDDGNLAMVERLDDRDNVIGPLTGTEEIIVSNQEELSEGQPVQATFVKDAKASEAKKAH